jgi:hypothetical protein
MHVLPGQVHLMRQPPQVLPERLQPEMVEAATRRMVERREWPRQAAYRTIGGEESGMILKVLSI